MRIAQYQVDAFAAHVFEGNPAAVCPLERWLDHRTLQAIAEENNLAETAFFVPDGERFHLRWFTPLEEVDLCGHATLAAAHVLFEELSHKGERIDFDTRSGRLTVERAQGRLRMDFPASVPSPREPPDGLLRGLGVKPLEVLAAADYIAVLASEAAVRAVSPDFARLATLDRRGVAITAPGDKHDFVSRFFAPRLGIPEDPVTGSAHCQLAPWWSARLGRTTLEARQVSRRGGNVTCEVKGDRVLLSGTAVTFLTGTIDPGA